MKEKKVKKVTNSDNLQNQETVQWLESLLDAVPFPISVTDLDMKWTFVNKAVMDMFGKKREDFIGKSCSEWGAAICGTQNCGIACLKKGKKQTFFEQQGTDYEVFVNYIYDASGKAVGHMEVVKDISSMKEIQKAQEQIIGAATSISSEISRLASVCDSSSNQLAKGAAEQSASMQELTASMDAIDEQTKESEQTIHSTSVKSTQAVEEVGNCFQQMKDLVEAMKTIEESAKSIGNIIATIDSIASKTNMLSLNASIEAARVGEQGRGFAVVAGQVGDLAGRSTEAAKNTKELISNTLAAVQNGSEITKMASESLDQVMKTITDIRDYSESINGAIEKEIGAISTVRLAMGQIADVTHNTSSIASENTRISNELLNQAEELSSIVKQRT